MSDHRGYRFAVLLIIAHGCSWLSPAAALAEDWPKIISKLERSGMPQKKQLPVAYNNYAIELSQRGDWRKAEDNLRKAVQLDGKNARYKQNLASVYLSHAYEVRRDRKESRYQLHAEAKRLAAKALRYDARLAEAHVLIGDIEYDNQNLRRARLAWKKAQSLKPSLAGLDDRMAKLTTEYSVEKQFDRAGNAFFDLRYQDDIDRSTAFDLSGMLIKARRTIGTDFKYWPKHKIVVLVYSEEDFAKVRSGPDWVGGLYDGKIRVPFPNSKAAEEHLKPTLYHEYTHAVIHDLTRNNCPVWLNEGIAEYQESKTRKPHLGLLRTATRIDRLIPLARLDSGFKNADPNVAGLAYQQSYSVVSHLVKSFGFYRVRRSLEHLAGGASLDEAFQEEFRMDIPRLEKRWKRSLPGLLR